jgi:hypothetical protein
MPEWARLVQEKAAPQADRDRRRPHGSCPSSNRSSTSFETGAPKKSHSLVRSLAVAFQVSVDLPTNLGDLLWRQLFQSHEQVLGVGHSDKFV